MLSYIVSERRAYSRPHPRRELRSTSPRSEIYQLNREMYAGKLRRRTTRRSRMARAERPDWDRPDGEGRTQTIRQNPHSNLGEIKPGSPGEIDIMERNYASSNAKKPRGDSGCNGSVFHQYMCNSERQRRHAALRSCQYCVCRYNRRL